MLHRFLTWLRGTPVSDETDETTEAQPLRSCTPLAEVSTRDVVTVGAVVASLGCEQRGGSPALVARVRDDSAEADVVWLGRRVIQGVNPGTTLRLTGRVTTAKGVTTMFNPHYTIVPHHHE